MRGTIYDLWLSLLAIALIGCGQSRIDQAYEQGRQAGYNEGLIQGLEKTKEEGLQRVAEVAQASKPWFVEMQWMLLPLGILFIVFTFVLLRSVIDTRRVETRQASDQLTQYIQSSQQDLQQLRSEMSQIRASVSNLAVEVKQVLIDLTKID
mgnify:FL=1